MAEFLWTWGFVVRILFSVSFFPDVKIEGLNWYVLLGVDDVVFLFETLLRSQLTFTSLKSSFFWLGWWEKTSFLTGFIAIFYLSASSSYSDSYSIESSESHSFPYTKSPSTLMISGSRSSSSESQSITLLNQDFTLFFVLFDKHWQLSIKFRVCVANFWKCICQFTYSLHVTFLKILQKLHFGL